MTAPGLAMFYGGLVRKKNVLSVMMQCLFLMGLNTVLWALYGYSLAFGAADGATKAYVGDADYLFMKGVAREWVDDAVVEPLYGGGAIPEIPRLTHMLFQGMFFIITPALICGAFAERMKFSAMVLFSILWGTIVYCPLAHWVWGGGMLSHPHSPYRVLHRWLAGHSILPGELWCILAPVFRHSSAHW
jgi:Amt family ammonium transporter